MKFTWRGKLKMIYGYVRVSTKKQNTDRQRRNILTAYPSAIIFEDIYTRTKFEGREDWEKLCSVVTSGDTIVFDSVSRMSGNADEGFSSYQEFYEKGIELIFLQESYVNTSVYKQALNNQISLTGTLTDIILEAINRYLMELAKQQIYIAFENAEKEILELHRRTIEGLETARRAGRVGGRPTISRQAQAQLYIMYYSGDYKAKEISEKTGIPISTLYNYVSKWKNDPATRPININMDYDNEYDSKSSSSGRPSIRQEVIDSIMEVYEYTDFSMNELAKYFGVSLSTVKKYCKDIEKKPLKL